MRKYCHRGLLLLLLLLPTVAYAGTRIVEGSTTGRYYNEVWKIWSEEPISVYVDEKGNTYIEGGEGLIYARGILYAGERQKFIELLRKGIKWAETARKEQLEITKNLGSFMKERSYGDKYGIKLTFFSANKGNQTDVILDIVDVYKRQGDILISTAGTAGIECIWRNVKNPQEVQRILRSLLDAIRKN